MKSLYDQYTFNVNKGPFHEPVDALPAGRPINPAVRLIAYYLPQFHRIPENDEWWGVGFTEWSNVTKALPRYVGHQQPRLPADLGFYDLSHADTLRRQAELARRGGIFGFCIHDYWFDGRKVLERPLQTLLDNADIDLPFCLNWANENWSRRWDGSEHSLLLEQRYDPDKPNGYVESIVEALQDPRYIRINGRPLIMVYRPKLIPNMARMADSWREYLVGRGLGDPYLVMAQTFDDFDPRPYHLDAAAGFPPHNGGLNLPSRRRSLQLLDRRMTEGKAASYTEMAERTLATRGDSYRLFPGVCPTWDNEARRPGRGTSYFGSTPQAYGDWLERAMERASEEPDAEQRIVFINAWNEWAEGAMLEPDRHYGHAYLAETRRRLDKVNRVPDTASAPAAVRRPVQGMAKPSRWNYLRNASRDARRKMLGMLSSRPR